MTPYLYITTCTFFSLSFFLNLSMYLRICASMYLFIYLSIYLSLSLPCFARGHGEGAVLTLSLSLSLRLSVYTHIHLLTNAKWLNGIHAISEHHQNIAYIAFDLLFQYTIYMNERA